MRPSRGFLLVTVLLLTSLLLVAGLALLGKEAVDYPEADLAVLAARAREVSLAGLEDALAKLEHDIDFPPPRSDDQVELSWTESLQDIGGETVGEYTVTVDLGHAGPPHSVLVVRSTGRVGPSDAPLAQRTVLAEIDLRQDTAGNPTYYRVINFLEL